MVIALTGIVCADQVVPAVPETQGLVTGTTADVIGLATETDAGAWSITSGGIPLNATDPVVAAWPGWPSTGGLSYASFVDAYSEALAEAPGMTLQDFINYQFENNPDPLPRDMMQNLKSYLSGQSSLNDIPLQNSQVRYTTVYDSNIVGQAGHTSFVKSMNINTGNKVISQSNLNANTILTYVATSDGGNVVGSDNLLIDGAGNTAYASDKMLCPFATVPDTTIPAYCNIVQAGSMYDLTIGSVTTNANDRFVGTDATNPVVLNYDISVKPYRTTSGQITAQGSAMAYIKAHIQESRGNTSQFALTDWFGPITVIGTPTKQEDLTYSETSSAQGTITAFTKVINYQSGKALL